jgi:hypothetical protein
VNDAAWPDSSEIVRIEVFRLRAGCPPEHLRQLLQVAEDAASIERVVAHGRRLREVSSRSASDGARDGGPVLEFRIHRRRGGESVLRRIENPAG